MNIVRSLFLSAESRGGEIDLCPLGYLISAGAHLTLVKNMDF